MKVVNENKIETLKEIYPKWDKWEENFSSLNNKDVISWLFDKLNKFTTEGKDASKFQIQVLIKYFDQYCQFNKVSNPSELVKEDIDDRNNRLRTYLNFLLKGDEEEIRKLGFKNRPSEISTINQIQGKVKSFYSNRGANISYGIKSRKKGENKNEILLSRNIIKQIQNKLESNQYRLICKFQSQLGLRVNDVLETLTSGKYQIEAYKTKDKPYYYIKDFMTQKEKVPISFMFFTEELTLLIQATYGIEDITKLDLKTLFRARKTPKTKRDEEGKPIKKNGKIQYYLDDEGNKIYTTKRINQNDYLRRVKDIVRDLGIKKNIKTHSFRKYFKGQLNQCKDIDKQFREHLMAHTIDLAMYDVDLEDPNMFFEQWKLAENFICVDCITIDNTSKLVNEHELELKRKDDQINDLQERIVKMESSIEKFMKMVEGKVDKTLEVIDHMDYLESENDD